MIIFEYVLVLHALSVVCVFECVVLLHTFSVVSVCLNVCFGYIHLVWCEYV